MKNFTIEIQKTIVSTIEADSYEEACVLATSAMGAGTFDCSFTQAEPKFTDISDGSGGSGIVSILEPDLKNREWQDYFCIGDDGQLWILGNHGDHEAAEDTAASLSINVVWLFGEQSAKDWQDQLGKALPDLVLNEKGWRVTTSDDGCYVYVEREDSPGQIHIKAEDEGFVADFWSKGDEPICVAGVAATFSELEPA